MTIIDAELEKAHREIGPIEPKWAQEDGVYIFEHPAYPFVMGGGPTYEEAVNSYHRALKGFIEERLVGNVVPQIDRATSGRGGFRPGSGRPRNSIRTITVRIPIDIADWLKDPEHVAQLRRLMPN